VSGAGEPGEDAYRRAGVDLEAASRAVALIKDLAGAVSRPEVVGGVGGFAGLVDLGDGRLLAASTDGVGTKLDVARLVGKLDTVGIDCVAMCANDVVCTGAEPLFFLDYLAVESLVPEEASAIVGGVAEGCRLAGCALLGGETAEHPGTMAAGSFDLAGFCVGIVGRDALLEPDRVRPGDVVLGFRSSGLHSNGFSLVRRVLDEGDHVLDAFVPELGRTLGEELLEPTLIYVRTVLRLARAGLVRSAAHITGGGLLENLPRALSPDLGAVIDTSAWQPHPIFDFVAEAAGVETKNLFSVLNMGLGFIVITHPSDADDAMRLARDSGFKVDPVGEVREGSGILLR
jgi:phosphoribosylformylglycinamidine cyclo-ligase